MSVSMWLLWGAILLLQNYSFTFVSRARNSGSLGRHVKAAILSNGVWFVSQIFAVKAFMDIITGHYGWGMAIFAAAFYTSFTVGGSVAAHYIALATEKGKAAVGANAKYAQIPADEWRYISSLVRSRVLTLDTDDFGGTFTAEELQALKLIANQAVAIVEVVDKPSIADIPPAIPAQGMKL
jgi:hypothetical protein